jgi:hypothetical protein
MYSAIQYCTYRYYAMSDVKCINYYAKHVWHCSGIESYTCCLYIIIRVSKRMPSIVWLIRGSVTRQSHSFSAHIVVGFLQLCVGINWPQPTQILN